MINKSKFDLILKEISLIETKIIEIKIDEQFDEEKIRKREERQKEKFEKLNKPKVHTVNELSEETKATLVQMADAEEVPAFNKETGSFNKDIMPTFEKE